MLHPARYPQTWRAPSPRRGEGWGEGAPAFARNLRLEPRVAYVSRSCSCEL
jgi:hypothetical protein